MTDESATLLCLTYKYRLLPTKRQHKALAEILESQRQLYNGGLEERIACYRLTGKTRGYLDQCKAVTELRQELEFATIPANLQRWTLKRLDDAYQAFFRRAKTKGEKAGFPRFRGTGRWNSFGFNEFSGIRLRGKPKSLKGAPTLPTTLPPHDTLLWPNESAHRARPRCDCATKTGG